MENMSAAPFEEEGRRGRKMSAAPVRAPVGRKGEGGSREAAKKTVDNPNGNAENSRNAVLCTNAPTKGKRKKPNKIPPVY
jgi:hypothetical protein